MPNHLLSAPVTPSWRSRVGALLSTMVVAACGGGAVDEPAAVPAPGGAVTVGAEGGTVLGPDGAQVVVPAGAASAPVTVRIAKDATDMPALPPHVSAVGDVFVLTPHGIEFGEPVRVSLPRPTRALRADEQLRVAKFSPGGSWELLAPEVSDRDLAVNVSGFSYFVPVVETYEVPPVVAYPALAATITSLTCGGGSCAAIVPDSVEVLMTVQLNGGLVPRACASPKLAVSVSGGGWGSGWISLGSHVATAIDPMAVPIAVGANPYNFRFSLRTSNGTAAGHRFGTQSTLAVNLQCQGPPVSNTSLVTAPLVFPAMGGGTAQFVFAASLSSPTCNGGSCVGVSGAQAVQTTATVPARAILPATCKDHPPRLQLRRPGGGVVAEASLFTITESTLLMTSGVSYPFAFTLQAPVPASRQDITARLVCGSGSYSAGNSGSISLVFVTPQQATLPGFTTQPRPMSVRVGQTASFTAVAEGFAPPTLQWQSRSGESAAWVDVPGATAGTLTTAVTTLDDNGRQFKAVATNPMGSTDSAIVTLSVTPNEQPPVIGHQPQALNVLTGSDAAFAVAASGTGALSYQWQFNGQPLTGANAPVLKLPAVGNAQAGSYRVVVSNAAGSVTSDAGVLTVGAVPVSPAEEVVVAYTKMQVAHGAFVVISADKSPRTGAGPASYSYQWFHNGQPIPGANNFPSITLLSAKAADAGVYAVTVAGVGPTPVAELSIIEGSAPGPVVVAVHPAPQVQVPLGSATFAVVVSGSGPMAFQWYRDGSPVPGATQPVLTLPAVTAADVGHYSVRVQNILGAVTSDAAPLVVLGAPAVTTSPVAQSVVEGATATFTVAASGSGLRYQWLLGGVPIGGADSASYTTPPLTLADSGGAFSVAVYNGAGLVFSSSALLTVTAAPVATPAQALGKIAMGGQHSCAITAAQAVACWGGNGSGQIGRGDRISQPTPFVWTLPEAAVQVAAGGNGSCAVTVSGQVWCSGSPTNSTVPVRLAGFSGVQQVTLGAVHACMLQRDGTVWCWGNNGSHQLGDGSTAPSATPVRVQGTSGFAINGVLGIDAGDNHTCARMDDNSVRCWGVNDWAQSGSASTVVTSRATPVAGAGFADHIAAGANFTCVYGSESGTVRCWGLALDGSSNSSPSPQETGPASPVAVGAGSAMVCVLDASARVWCWGAGAMGNGNGNQTQAVPARVSGLTEAVAVAGGLGHTCVLRSTGALVCWGSNSSYQLGNGDAVSRTTPTEVPLAGGFWRP